jgi:hypothetical protein
MKKFILKVGYILTGEEKIDALAIEIVNCLTAFYCGILTTVKPSAFMIPCAAECGDTSCGNNMPCNLAEYEFQTVADQTPDNVMRCFAALAMCDPVVCVQTLNPDDPNDLNFWNRFGQDDTMEDTLEVSKEIEAKNLN